MKFDVFWTIFTEKVTNFEEYDIFRSKFDFLNFFDILFFGQNFIIDEFFFEF